MNIILNGEPHELEKAETSYEQLCKMAGMNSKKTPTVTYALRHGGCYSLALGEKAKLAEGAVIHVTGSA